MYFSIFCNFEYFTTLKIMKTFVLLTLSIVTMQARGESKMYSKYLQNVDVLAKSNMNIYHDLPFRIGLSEMKRTFLQR